MTYTKPSNVSYTDMCIYIADNIYTDHYKEELVFEYLYHIVLMLALKAKLFTRNCYYDSFAIFAASRIFFRLTNKKQFDLDDSGQPVMKRIKSVLNYTKKTLYYLKVDYEQREYSQSLVSDEVNTTYNYDNVVRDSVRNLSLVEFEMTMNDIAKTCKMFLKTIPYKQSSADWMNIYTSVLLTFMNSITIRNKNLRRIDHLSSTNRLKDSNLQDMFLVEKYEKPILFHLDETMSDYITVLTRQLRKIVAKDLSSIIHTNVSDEVFIATSVVKDYLMEEVFDEDKY